MSCQKAFEIDLEDLLLSPDSEEFRVFEEHSRSCSDCASELSSQRGLVARLRGMDPAESGWHPSDELLLQMRADVDAIPAVDYQRVQQHFTACGRCRDAFEAFRALAALAPPEAVREPFLQQLLAQVRSIFELMPSPAVVSAAAAGVLALGMFVVSDPFGPADDEAYRLRGGETPLPEIAVPDVGAVTVTLLAGQPSTLRAESVAQKETVLFELLVPAGAAEELWVESELLEDPPRLAVAEKNARGQAIVRVEVAAQRLVSGRYTVRLLSGENEDSGAIAYILEIR